MHPIIIFVMMCRRRVANGHWPYIYVRRACREEDMERKIFLKTIEYPPKRKVSDCLGLRKKSRLYFGRLGDFIDNRHLALACPRVGLATL